MGEEEFIELDKKTMEKILFDLKEIRIICSDKKIKERIQSIIEFAQSKIYSQMEPSLKELIYNKMKETKKNNPDLSSKLYILYRNLIDEKISEEDAKKIYESYIVMDGFEKIVW
ncbi:hypothetical protein [Clostridium niameyense]|nr:hypothetical protein [Clostridium niameyense]